jgi:hypothetical protein
VVFYEGDVHFFPEGPEVKGGIGEVLEVLDHVGAFGVAVDVSDTGDVVFVGVDDARCISIAPEVSGPSDPADGGTWLDGGFPLLLWRRCGNDWT